jgi:hypothetical protein
MIFNVPSDLSFICNSTASYFQFCNSELGEKSEGTSKLYEHIWSVLGTVLGFELNSKYNVLKYQTRPHSGNFSCISRYLFALAVSSGWSLDHPLNKRRFTKCKLQEQDSIPYRTVLQKRAFSQLVKKFPFNSRTRKFIPVFEVTSH